MTGTSGPQQVSFRTCVSSDRGAPLPSVCCEPTQAPALENLGSRRRRPPCRARNCESSPRLSLFRGSLNAGTCCSHCQRECVPLSKPTQRHCLSAGFPFLLRQRWKGGQSRAAVLPPGGDDHFLWTGNCSSQDPELCPRGWFVAVGPMMRNTHPLGGVSPSHCTHL